MVQVRCRDINIDTLCQVRAYMPMATDELVLRAWLCLRRSLGCVMYELTAMRPPFDAFNIRGLVEKITKYVAPPLPAEYSDNWKNIIKRCGAVQHVSAAPTRCSPIWTVSISSGHALQCRPASVRPCPLAFRLGLCPGMLLVHPPPRVPAAAG